MSDVYEIVCVYVCVCVCVCVRQIEIERDTDRCKDITFWPVVTKNNYGARIKISILPLTSKTHKANTAIGNTKI